MVARIGQGGSLKQSFYYNENKVREGIASLILAQNYPLQGEQLNERMRLGMLQKLAALRPNCKVNSLHISLNFDASEQLPTEKLGAIAKDYMARLGFGSQPFLVYEHRDAGHPHIHILTTNIEADGKRISLHNLAREKSEPARKEIEEHYGLVKAEQSKNAEKYKLEAVSSIAIYGRTETKRAIQNVLQTVLTSYRYSSLPELSAILRCYNVGIETGKEGSRMAAANGLYYRILDDNGEHVGTPIKASAFYMKPTLAWLDQQFAYNHKYKVSLLDKVKVKVKGAARRSGNSLDMFKNGLRKVGIDLLFRKNADGEIYGVTFIDHLNKVVFNGRALDKELSAKELLQRFDQKQVLLQNETSNPTNIILEGDGKLRLNGIELLQNIGSAVESVADVLLSTEHVFEPNPYAFQIGRRKKRKKKKR